MPRLQCTFPDCDHLNFSRGYCQGHAAQLRKGKNLTPLRTARPPAVNGEYWCSTCKKYQPLDDFPWDTTRDAPQRVCRSSKNEKQRVAGTVRINTADAYRADKPGHIARKKNLTREQYLGMFDMQSHLCALCGAHNDSEKFRLAVDHDHKTGVIRGLLCRSCNLGLGNFKDDIALLEKAIEYLRSGGPLSTLGLTVEGEFLI